MTVFLQFVDSSRSSQPEVFYRKGALRNFAKFTGKTNLRIKNKE